jgi:hypothetical protein
MNIRSFNLIASSSAFVLGAIYVFSDSRGITANVIGATGNNAGFTALIGMAMIISAIGLFIVSMHSTDNHAIDLERLVRRTKNHQDIHGEEHQDDRDTQIPNKN